MTTVSSSLVMWAISSLRSGSPGTTAGVPERDFRVAPSRVSRRSLALRAASSARRAISSAEREKCGRRAVEGEGLPVPFFLMSGGDSGYADRSKTFVDRLH
jgi:hypothetical protein